MSLLKFKLRWSSLVRQLELMFNFISALLPTWMTQKTHKTWMIIAISTKPWKIRYFSIKAWSLFDRLQLTRLSLFGVDPCAFPFCIAALLSHTKEWNHSQNSELCFGGQGFCFNLPLLHLCKTFFSFKCWSGRSIQLLACTSVGQGSPEYDVKETFQFLLQTP